MIPKPRKRIINPQLVASYRTTCCQVCGKTKGLQNHHIFSRGSGGPDSKWNLITLDFVCHTKVHNGNIPKVELLLVKAKQVQDEPEEIQAMLDYCYPRLNDEDFQRLRVACRKEPEVIHNG